MEWITANLPPPPNQGSPTDYVIVILVPLFSWNDQGFYKPYPSLWRLTWFVIE